MFKLFIELQTFWSSGNFNRPNEDSSGMSSGRPAGDFFCVILFQSNAKLKLVRSLAVCEESSGPFSTDGPPESVLQLTSRPNLHP